MNPESTQLRDQQLSAEAKSFVPKNHLFGSTLKPASLAGRHHTVHIPCSRPPNYATMCHPITNPDSFHSRPRLSATWEGPGRPQYLQNSELSNGLKSYCLSERGILLPQSMAWDDLSEYNRVQSYSQHQYLSQAVPDTQVFSTSHTLPPGFALLDVQYPMSGAYPAVQYSPDNPMVTTGYPGMALSPFVENGTTLPSTHKWPKKVMCSHSKRKEAVFNSNQVTVGVQYEMNGQDVDIGLQQKPVSKSRTIICRDYETQTDFSTEIADKNLQTLPSPLYDEALKNRTVCENSTETDGLDAEDAYSVIPMTHWMPNNNATLYPKPDPCPHSNVDSMQYLMDDGSSAYLCVADSGVLPEDFRYCVLNDLPSTSVDAGHTSPGHRVLNTSPYGYADPVPGGFYWKPRSLVETDPTQLRNQKRGRQKTRRGNNHGTHGSGTADSGLRTTATMSVGTDSLTRGIREMEDEFPRLLIAADGLSLLGFENGNLTEAFVRNRLAGDQHENFQPQQWTGSTFPYGTRQISSSNRERMGKGSKKKQKRQEQLSRAADEELAQISLEQQVLSEMGNNRRRLVIPFRLDHSSSQSEGSISGVNSEPVTHSENSDITLESAEFSHNEDCSKPIDANKTGFVEMVICKRQGNNEKNCAHERITELSTAVNGLTVDIQRNNIVLFGVDLSLSASSKNSSMDNNSSSRASPVSTEMSPISQTSPFDTSSLTASPAGSGVTSPRLDLQDLKKSSIVTSIHSPRFREYCNQVLSREIDECCTQLLAHLVRFQDKFYQFESSSSLNMVKRRTVLGLREVTKHLRQSKLCCVIISPNMEQIQSKGLDEALRNIIRLCEQQHVLVVFALGRHALGRALAKLVPVSVVGIFSCEGAEEHFHRLQRLTREARSAYQDLVTSLLQASPSITLENGCSNDTTGHSRTPSGCSIMSLTSSSVLSEPISENELETEDQNVNISAPPPPYLGQNAVPIDATDSGSQNNIVANGLCDDLAADSEVSEDDKIIVCEKLLESYEVDSECSLQNGVVRCELDSKQSRDLCTGHVTQENGRPENSDLDDRFKDASLVNACAGITLKPKALHNNCFESCATVGHSITASTSDQLSANVVATSVCDDISADSIS